MPNASGFASPPEFSKHSENLAEIRKSLTQIERAHKAAIRGGQLAAIQALQRVHHLLLGVLAEATLRKILTDPTSGFDSEHRMAIWKKSQPDRWIATVEHSFRLHYEVGDGQPLNAGNLGVKNYDRYESVTRLVRNELHPVITHRNRIAHGQWLWQLKSQQDNTFKAGEAPLPPVYTVSKAQSDLLALLSRLVYVLVVSEKTFDRDYGALIREIDEVRATVLGAGYEDFVATLKSRAARGRAVPQMMPASNA